MSEALFSCESLCFQELLAPLVSDTEGGSYFLDRRNAKTISTTINMTINVRGSPTIGPIIMPHKRMGQILLAIKATGWGPIPRFVPNATNPG